MPPGCVPGMTHIPCLDARVPGGRMGWRGHWRARSRPIFRKDALHAYKVTCYVAGASCSRARPCGTYARQMSNQLSPTLQLQRVVSSITYVARRKRHRNPAKRCFDSENPHTWSIRLRTRAQYYCTIVSRTPKNRPTTDCAAAAAASLSFPAPAGRLGAASMWEKGRRASVE